MGSLIPLNLIRAGNRTIEMREAHVIIEIFCGTVASTLLPQRGGFFVILSLFLGVYLKGIHSFNAGLRVQVW